MLALEERSKDQASAESSTNKSNAATIHPINSRFEFRVSENSRFGATGLAAGAWPRALATSTSRQ
jgi:hypothetical protein